VLPQLLLLLPLPPFRLPLHRVTWHANGLFFRMATTLSAVSLSCFAVNLISQRSIAPPTGQQTTARCCFRFRMTSYRHCSIKPTCTYPRTLSTICMDWSHRYVEFLPVTRLFCIVWFRIAVSLFTLRFAPDTRFSLFGVSTCAYVLVSLERKSRAGARRPSIVPIHVYRFQTRFSLHCS
jgi:hypothetical protein